MKRVAIVLIFGIVSVASAGVPPALQTIVDYGGNWYSLDKQTGEWNFIGNSVTCDERFAEAAADGVAETLVIDIPWNSPLGKPGPRTVKELKEYCLKAVKASTVSGWVGWVKNAVDDDRGDIAVICVNQYNAMVKDRGLAPTTKLPYEGIGLPFPDKATGDPFRGTLEAARTKYCDPKAKGYQDAAAANEEPYRRVMKAGKLEIALKNLSAAIYGPGKKELATPAAMAKANVWFRSIHYPENYCRNGESTQYQVRRYQFDAKHKLVKDSAKDYCGAPPASAFK